MNASYRMLYFGTTKMKLIRIYKRNMDKNEESIIFCLYSIQLVDGLLDDCIMKGKDWTISYKAVAQLTMKSLHYWEFPPNS